MLVYAMNKDNILEVFEIVEADMSKVWNCFTHPDHIVNWYYASEDWYAPRAMNDLTPGGKFLIEMSARDKSTGFDFEGVYENVELYKIIEYKIADGRKVKIIFTNLEKGVQITEFFEAELVNKKEYQIKGWQSILSNFKKYVENN
jgi:uncharacterized protein YndB with AHSA1/START domain